MNYLKNFSTKQTPQSQSIPGSNQVPNSAGGFAWEVDKWERLNRFLILGSEGGSYYASEANLTIENATGVLECISENGLRTVETIVDISTNARAPKNDPAIFALALCASQGDDATRKLALDNIPTVCRTGTHLFTFCTFVQQFRGWGRGLRNAVAAWYEGKDLGNLSYQLIKYRQRDGWTHRDVMRQCHPKANNTDQNLVFAWAAHKEGEGGRPKDHLLPQNIRGFEKAQRSKSAHETAELIRTYELPREALQTEHLKSPEVWEALLYAGGFHGMPLTAMIRNLATMTRVGLLAPASAATQRVTEVLSNAEAIKAARVHPIAVLAAEMTYAGGHGQRGTNTWNPIPQIVDALDDAFYMAFDNVEGTGKSRLMALDISGSMGWSSVAGIPGLTPRIASAAMAMVGMKSGDPYEVVVFASGRNYRDHGYGRGVEAVPLSPRQRLDDVLNSIDQMYAGGTDCALPAIYAKENKREVDVIEIFTDSETWAGSIHPSQALEEYRRQSGRDTKQIVYGMVSNGFTIADPNDSRQLDVVGFDTAVPTVVESFIKGEF